MASPMWAAPTSTTTPGVNRGGHPGAVRCRARSEVVAAAPVSGSAGLLDVGARTTQGGAFEGIYLRNFGPLVVGVPASELAAEETRCDQRAGVASLRFVVVDVNDDREVEFGCLDLPALGTETGGTVVVTNRSNGRMRCARIDETGRFRIGVPASRGDKLEVGLWDQPDAVDRYGDAGCHVTLGLEHRVELIKTWGNGLVAPGPRSSAAAGRSPFAARPTAAPTFKAATTPRATRCSRSPKASATSARPPPCGAS